jgi:hypothetical protein
LMMNLDSGIITRVAGDPSKTTLFGSGLITNVASNGTLVTYTMPAHTFTAGQTVRITDIPAPNQNLNLTGVVASVTASTVVLTSTQPVLSSTAVNATMGIQAVLAGIVNPYNIVMDSLGNIYFPNQYFANSCVLKVDTDGYISRYAGSGVFSTSGNSVHRLSTSCTVRSPRGIAIDSSNNIYIADTDNYVVRKVDASTNLVTTIFGNMGVQALIASPSTRPYPSDGVDGTSVYLRSPTALVVDATSTNLYVVDFNGNAATEYTGIYRYNFQTGKVYVLVKSLAGYSGDGGPSINAQLGNARGIDVDSSNNLYISDSNGGIRKIDTSGIITTYTDGSNYGIVWHLVVRTPSEIYATTGDNNQVGVTTQASIYV